MGVTIIQESNEKPNIIKTTCAIQLSGNNGCNHEKQEITNDPSPTCDLAFAKKQSAWHSQKRGIILHTRSPSETRKQRLGLGIFKAS